MKKLVIFFIFSTIFSAHGQWTRLSHNLDGEIIKSINEGESIYISMPNALFRSDDRGERWIELSKDFPELIKIWDYCVYKNYVFVSYYNYLTNEETFAISIDKGMHWVDTNITKNNYFIYKLAITQGRLIAYTSKGLIESEDFGKNWHSSHFNQDLYPSDILKGNKDFFYIQNNRGIFSKKLQDTSWQQIYVNNNEDRFSNYSLFINDSFLVTNISNHYSKSIDNGKNWESIKLPIFEDKESSLIINSMDWYIYRFDSIFISHNLGSSWEYFSNGLGDSLIVNSFMNVGKNIIASSNELGFIKLNKSNSKLNIVNYGFNKSRKEKIILADSLLFILGDRSFERYHIFQKSIQHQFTTKDYFNSMCYSRDNLFLLSLRGQKIYISKDKGMSFRSIAIKSKLFGEDVKMFHYLNKLIICSQNGLEAFNLDGSKYDPYNSIYNKSPADVTIYENSILVAKRYGKYKTTFYRSNDLIKWKEIKIKLDSNYSFTKFIQSEYGLFMEIEIDSKSQYMKLNDDSSKLSKCFGIFNVNMGKVISGIKGTKEKSIILTNYGFYKSEDGGNYWTRIIEGIYPYEGHHIIDVVLKNEKIYALSNLFGLLETKTSIFLTKSAEGKIVYDSNGNNLFDTTDLPFKTDDEVYLIKSDYYIPIDNYGTYRICFMANQTDTLIPNIHNKNGEFSPIKIAITNGCTNSNLLYISKKQIEDLKLSCSSYITDLSDTPQIKYEITVRNEGNNACSGNIHFCFKKPFTFSNSSADPQFKTKDFISWENIFLKPFESKEIELILKSSKEIPKNFNIKNLINLNNLTCKDSDLIDNEIILNRTLEDYQKEYKSWIRY